jgi:putative transposase
MDTRYTKIAVAHDTGISRSMLYYEHKQFKKDWELKIRIEEVLHGNPSYGHKRLAIYLKTGKNRILRVMKIYGIKPYRRRGKKPWKKRDKPSNIYPNLLMSNMPQRADHIWASDFTHITYKGKTVYIATVLDIFTREIVGWSAMTTHSVQLVINALMTATMYHGVPEIIHSDQGSEYTSKDYTSMVEQLGMRVSMSRRASPWENGYQESFYNQFKVDLGDPNRFETLGELIAGIHQTIYAYNTKRIHTKLKMPPRQYAMMHSLIQPINI